jgi:CoA:oxalate CoA-transferase
MDQIVRRENGLAMKTTRVPMRFDGNRFASSVGSPKIGEHTARIVEEFNL